MSDLPDLTPKDKTTPQEQPQQHEGLISEFLHSAAYAAVQEPLKGVSQLVDHLAGTNLEKSVTFMDKPQGGSGTGDWMAQQLGGAAGMLLPFMLARGGVRSVMGESLKGTETAATLGMSLKEAGLTGFTYDALLRPADENSKTNFWAQRGLNGVSGAATFMTLTGSAYGLGKLSNIAESRGLIGASTLVPIMRNPMAAGILSGVPAGLVSAEGSSLVSQHRLATSSEIGQSIAGMSFVGGVFGANEVVKAKYTDGKSIPSFVAQKIQDAWNTPAEPRFGLAFAAGDTVGPDGARFSVERGDGGQLAGTRQNYLDRLIARPDTAELKSSTTMDTGAGKVKADVYEEPLAPGKRNATAWKDYELTRPDGTKATFEMVRTKDGDPSYVYKEGDNQVVLKWEGGWQVPKGVSMPRGEGSTQIAVRTTGSADMINLHPVVVDALLNDPVLREHVSGWQSQDVVQAMTGSKTIGTGEGTKAFVIYPKDEESTSVIADRLNKILGQKATSLNAVADSGATSAGYGNQFRLTVTREALQPSADSTEAQPLGKVDKSVNDAIRHDLKLADGDTPTADQLRSVEKDAGIKPGLLTVDSEGAIAMKISPALGREGSRGDAVYMPDTAAKGPQPTGELTDRSAYYALVRTYGMEPTYSHLDGITAPETGPQHVKVAPPKGRAADLTEGIKLLNNASKATATADDVQAFVDYAASEKGDGLADKLRLAADQLRTTDDANALIDHAYAIPEAKQLLEAASGDEATQQQRDDFEEYVRNWGGSLQKVLTDAAGEMKNQDIASALVEKAYADPEVNVQVEPGQESALRKGLAVLRDPVGVTDRKLQVYAESYGPAMEKPLSDAADQLRLGPDVKLMILKAYHPEMEQGVDILRDMAKEIAKKPKSDTSPIDTEKLQAFAQGDGKGLEPQMRSAALELGLYGEPQRAIYEAYQGQKAWVDIEDRPNLAMPIPPEKEQDFLNAVEVAKMVAEPDAPAAHRALLESFLHSPDHESLTDDLINYFKLAATPEGDKSQSPENRALMLKAGALVREAAFGTDENVHITGKPDQIQVADMIKSDDPNVTDSRARRVIDFNDLADELANASKANAETARGALFNWLDRNPDLANVAQEYARQSADSRVVSALDSYFSTDNMDPFFESRTKYEAAVAVAVAPETVARINQSGNDLFWEMAPDDPENPRMWGNETHASKNPMAYKVDIPDPSKPATEQDVVAHFRNHPAGVSEVEDRPDGTRIITYTPEQAAKDNIAQIVKNPNKEDIVVLPDGSWYSELNNGNLIEEFSDAHGGNVVRHLRENGDNIYLYRDGTVGTLTKDGQFATTADAAAREQVDQKAQETEQRNAASPFSSSDANQLSAVLTRDTAAYSDKIQAAIALKDHFGTMTDQQFKDWLDFASGTHEDARGRQMSNWQDLRTPGIESLFFNADMKNLLTGGKTDAERSSAAGQARAEQGRELVRNFLDAPDVGETNNQQFSQWLNSENRLPPESWPEWLQNDVRARFQTDSVFHDSVPPDVQQYLADNPERTTKLADEKYPPRPTVLPEDTLSGRLATMANVMEYAPKELQEPLLRLGAQDGRVVNDIMRTLMPKPGETKAEVPKEYLQLLKLTIPNAEDIYSVKVLLSALKDIGYAARKTSPEGKAQYKGDQEVIMEARNQLMTPANAKELSSLITGFINGQYEIPGGGGGRDGKGRDGGRDGKGRDGGRDGKGRDGGRDGKGRERNKGQDQEEPIPLPDGGKPPIEEAGDEEAQAAQDAEEEASLVENWQGERDGLEDGADGT